MTTYLIAIYTITIAREILVMYNKRNFTMSGKTLLFVLLAPVAFPLVMVAIIIQSIKEVKARWKKAQPKKVA